MPFRSHSSSQLEPFPRSAQIQAILLAKCFQRNVCKYCGDIPPHLFHLGPTWASPSHRGDLEGTWGATVGTRKQRCRARDEISSRGRPGRQTRPGAAGGHGYLHALATGRGRGRGRPTTARLASGQCSGRGHWALGRHRGRSHQIASGMRGRLENRRTGTLCKNAFLMSIEAGCHCPIPWMVLGWCSLASKHRCIPMNCEHIRHQAATLL